MSFSEKSAWVLLVAAVAVAGFYIRSLTGAGFDVGSLSLVIKAVAAFVVLVVVGQIVISVLRPSEADKSDERDLRIARRAEAVGSGLLSIVLLGIVALGAWQEQWMFVHLAYLALLAAEIAKASMQIVQYRVGN
ncbi:MAG: hypothetical protein ACWA5T_11415 [Parvularcula sp.]